MAIQIGAKPDSGFDDPLGLLSDCHRRIEKFLDQLLFLAKNSDEALTPTDRESLDTCLRYFRKGAPMHTSDEEHSLFPPLQALNSPPVREMFEHVALLESEHRTAELAHAEVDTLCTQWMREGRVEPERRKTLINLLTTLKELYRTHIAFEDEVLFPLARRELSANQMAAIGREMAERRGLDYDNLPLTNRCAERRLQRETVPADA